MAERQINVIDKSQVDDILLSYEERKSRLNGIKETSEIPWHHFDAFGYIYEQLNMERIFLTIPTIKQLLIKELAEYKDFILVVDDSTDKGTKLNSLSKPIFIMSSLSCTPTSIKS